MLCIDRVDKKNKPIDFRLFGSDEHGPHKMMEIVYRPCTASRRNRRCRMNKAKLARVKKWLGAPEFTILYNTEHINFAHFDERKINKEAVITSYQWSPKQPITIQSKLHKHVLNDNIQFL
jgi:hypothetical protein